MTISELVAKKLKLFSRKRVLTLLEGNYDSLFRGRSVDLASLREYVPGDNVKDIDWSSTARTNVVHTKLYSPLRDQKFLIVPDLSPSMLVEGEDSLNKVESVMALMVMIGAFVRKNNDQMSITGFDGTKVVHTRYGRSSNHLEKLLRTYDSAVYSPGPKPGVLTLLDNVRHGDRSRSSIIIVSDELQNHKELKSLLSRLRRRHQIFYIHLPPASPLQEHFSRDGVVDVETGKRITLPLLHSHRLQQEWDFMHETWLKEWERTCRATGTCYVSLASASKMPEALQTLFKQAKQYARR